MTLLRLNVRKFKESASLSGNPTYTEFHLSSVLQKVSHVLFKYNRPKSIQNNSVCASFVQFKPIDEIQRPPPTTVVDLLLRHLMSLKVEMNLKKQFLDQ